MLFDIEEVRGRLPAGVTVFASGANRKAEIEGFGRLGIPVGVSVPHLNEAAIDCLIDLGHPVMIDSGAFSEVSFRDGRARIVAPISDQEWRRRLAIYFRLASALGEKATLVAPDQVGSQKETLRRLAAYRNELSSIVATGASLLLPLQVGAMSHADFYRAAKQTAGVALVPAMPMRKAVTTAAALADFVQDLQPRRLHLLGMGIDNHNAQKVLRIVQHFSPETAISMDSNRLRAKAGKVRVLTRTESELHAAPAEDIYGAVESPTLALLGIGVDYTDQIAYPAAWCEPDQLQLIARAVALTPAETETFMADPDGFLQFPCRSADDLRWMEHPVMSIELDRAWHFYIECLIRSSVRSAAIIASFADSPIRSIAPS
jgi:hypothetical protein